MRLCVFACACVCLFNFFCPVICQLYLSLSFFVSVHSSSLTHSLHSLSIDKEAPSAVCWYLRECVCVCVYVCALTSLSLAGAADLVHTQDCSVGWSCRQTLRKFKKWASTCTLCCADLMQTTRQDNGLRECNQEIFQDYYKEHPWNIYTNVKIVLNTLDSSQQGSAESSKHQPPLFTFNHWADSLMHRDLLRVLRLYTLRFCYCIWYAEKQMNTAMMQWALWA